jgi:hypothetical protein
MAFVRDAEARAALAEREAWERVLRVEAKSASALASGRGEAEDLAWRMALIEGDLAEVCQARDMAEENSQGLSDAAAGGV